MLKGKRTIGTVAYMGGVMTVPEPFCWSLAQMIQYNTEYVCQLGEIINYEKATVSYHAFARNSLVERIQGDWILFLDTDHSFDPDILARLLYKMDKHDIDVITGIYQYKTPPYVPVLYTWNEDKTGFQVLGDWDKEAEIFQIASAGGGCLLVRKKVFERINKELKEGPFDIIPPFSEDHSFFKRLEKLDIKVYCDPKIECNHLAYKSINLSDYDKSMLAFTKKITVEGRK